MNDKLVRFIARVVGVQFALGLGSAGLYLGTTIFDSDWGGPFIGIMAFLVMLVYTLQITDSPTNEVKTAKPAGEWSTAEYVAFGVGGTILVALIYVFLNR